MPRTRLSGPADLALFRKQARAEQERHRGRVLICMTGCRSLGAIELGVAFRKKVAAAGLADEVAVVDVGCHGPCALAPVVVIEPQDYLYSGVKPDDVDEIIETTLRGGKPVERLCQATEGRPCTTVARVPFYAGLRRTSWPIAGAWTRGGSRTRSPGEATQAPPGRCRRTRLRRSSTWCSEAACGGAAGPASRRA